MNFIDDDGLDAPQTSRAWLVRTGRDQGVVMRMSGAFQPDVVVHLPVYRLSEWQQ